MFFGPHQAVAGGDGGAQRTRADAITVAGDLDEVVNALRTAENGWAELVMQVTEDARARVYVNAQRVRYVREA
jgi:hypothetical protein